MKTKKAQTSVISSLIIIVLVIGLAFIIYFYTLKPTAEGQSNIDSVKSWVWATAAKKKVTLGAAPAKMPPVPYLKEPYYAQSEADLKDNVIPMLADSIYDCASAFQFGEINFLDNLGSNKFCFQCSSVKILESLKSSGYKLNLKEYMANTKPAAGIASYEELLREKAEKNNFAVVMQQTTDGMIPTSKDLYVYFMAMDKKLTIQEAALVGAAPGIIIGVFLGPVGLMTAVAATTLGAVGTNQVYNTWLHADDKFKTMVYVASYEEINKICNAKIG